MDYKEKDKEQANSMAISLTKSLDDCITEGNGCKVKKAIERELLVMAAFKDKQFESLINSLPESIKQLITSLT